MTLCNWRFVLWWLSESDAVALSHLSTVRWPLPRLWRPEEPQSGGGEGGWGGRRRRRKEEEEEEGGGWKNSAADIYPACPHESRMWKLTPALSLHFLRVPVANAFVCMTVNFSASLSSGFVGPCWCKARRETNYKGPLRQINTVGGGGLTANAAGNAQRHPENAL